MKPENEKFYDLVIPDFKVDLNGKFMQYDGNPKLKPAQSPLPFTVDHILELERCQNDIEYFAEKYFYIVNLDEGLIKIGLRDYQRKILHNFQEHRNNIVLASRQCVAGETKISLRSKKSKKIISISIEDAFHRFGEKNKKWDIESDIGWQTFSGIMQTIPIETISLGFADGRILTCSLKHRLFKEDGDEFFAEDIKIGDRLKAKGGSIEVILIKEGLTQNLYDVLNSENKKYYSNNILSHNCGKSTMYEIYLVHYILFNDHKSALILANKERTAVSLMGRVREAYNNLPKWLQQGVVEWSKTAVVFENGSSVKVSSTSSSACRGESVNLLLLDEMAFVLRGTWDAFYSSVYPTISSAKTTKVIMVSTPNGKNHFYKMWTEANENENNTFFPTKVYWHEVPGRDEEWAKETRANIGDQKFEQEFNISFLGSSSTLISSSSIEGMALKQPVPRTENILYDRLGSNQVHLKVYRPRKEGHIYSIGVDTSKMTEEIQGDSVCVQVLDITTMPFKQVATFYADRDFSYYELPEVCDILGRYYNDATVFVENNEIGQTVADNLWVHYEYEGVYFEKGNLPGFRTTTKTKRKGCIDLRTFIENGKLEIVDFETISQLSTFVKKGNSYQAEKTYYDDAVMALIASLHFLQTAQFNHFDDMKKLVEELIKKKQMMDEGAISAIPEEIEEDVPAFGAFGSSHDSILETVF